MHDKGVSPPDFNPNLIKQNSTWPNLTKLKIHLT